MGYKNEDLPFDLYLSSVYLSRALKLTVESENSRVIEYGVCGEERQFSVGSHGYRRSIPYRLHMPATYACVPLFPVQACR